MNLRASSVLDELLREAHRLKNERCEAFPNLICNETPKFDFDNWCDPCKTRRIVKGESLGIFDKSNPNNK
jgi:hypothetical protein